MIARRDPARRAQKEGSAKISSHAGKAIGGLVGNALFDEAGEKIGEAVGDKLGKLAGSLAYERMEKQHVKKSQDVAVRDGLENSPKNTHQE